MSINGPEFEYWQNKKPRYINLKRQSKVHGDFKNLATSVSEPDSNRSVVIVETSNGRLFELECTEVNRVQELFDVVVQQLNVVEHFYFGLAWVNEKDEYLFLNLKHTLKEVAPKEWLSGSVPSFKLHFLLKFYPSTNSPSAAEKTDGEECIKSECTKQLLYWQTRRDIVSERLDCSEVDSILFGAIALQAEYGDYTGHTADNTNIRSYVSESIVEWFGEDELVSELCRVHRNYFGYERSEAQSLLIREAAKLPDFGCFYYQLGDGNEANLVAVSSSGLLGIRANESDWERKIVFTHDWNELLSGSLADGEVTFSIKSSENNKLRLNFRSDLFKALYFSQLCNVLFKLNRAIKIQRSEAETTEKMRMTFSVGSLFGSLDEKFASFNEEKRIRLYLSGRNDTMYENATLKNDNNIEEKSRKDNFETDTKETTQSPKTLRSPPSSNQNGTVRRVETIHLQSIGNITTCLTLKHGKSDKSIYIDKVLPGCEISSQNGKGVVVPEDRVLAINGMSLEESNLTQARNLIAASGSKIELIVSRFQKAEGQLLENENISVKRRIKRGESIAFDFEFMDSGSEKGDKGGNVSPEKQEEQDVSPKSYLSLNNSSTKDEVFLSPLETSPNNQVSSSSPGNKINQVNHGDYFKVDLGRINGALGVVLCDNHSRNGVFVRSLTANGSADLDGQIKPGDRVCKIHGNSVDNIDAKETVTLLRSAPQVVRIELQRWMLPINEYQPRPPPSHDSFVNKNNTFFVTLTKEESRGDEDVDSLGFTASGFADVPCGTSEELIPRIRQLQLGGPAQRVGVIRNGDVILSVNGFPMKSRPYDDFVHTVRASKRNVCLELCRPLPGVLIHTSKCQVRNQAKEMKQNPSNQNKTTANLRNLEIPNFHEVHEESQILQMNVQLHKLADESMGIVFKSLNREKQERNFAIVKRIAPGSLADAQSDLRPGDLISELRFDSPSFTVNGSKCDFLNNSGTMKLIKQSEGTVQLDILRKGEQFEHLESCSLQKLVCSCLLERVSDIESVKNGGFSRWPVVQSRASDYERTKPDCLVIQKRGIEKPLFKVKGATHNIGGNLARKVRDTKNSVLSNEWKVQFEEMNLATMQSNGSSNYSNIESKEDFLLIDYYFPLQTAPLSYILAQSPTDQNILDFLNIIWKQDVKVIVTFDETGLLTYVPESLGEQLTFDDFVIYLKQSEESQISSYKKLQIKRRQSGSSTEVQILTLKNWSSDHVEMMPATSEIIQFVNLARMLLQRCEQGSTFLAVSADIDNQASVITILHVLLRTVELDHEVDLPKIVDNFREFRPSILWREEIFKFLYLCYIALLESI